MNPNKRIFMEPQGNCSKSRAVFNPTIYQDGKNVHIFYRTVNSNLISSIGYAKGYIDNRGIKLTFKKDEPILFPEHDYEAAGIEDPRITKIDDKYYLFYTVYDGSNVRVAYATSKYLVSFTKKGIVSPNLHVESAINLIKKNPNLEYYIKKWSWQCSGHIIHDKDFALFPEKINGKYALIHRLHPDMQIAYFNSFDELQSKKYWINHISNLEKHLLLKRKYKWEESHIGLGATPLKTKKGWLLINHGVIMQPGRLYQASAVLLDLKNPQIIKGRLQEPLFSPEEKWEKVGDVNNVVFPTGLAEWKGNLYILYGAADKVIGEYHVNLEELLNNLIK